MARLTSPKNQFVNLVRIGTSGARKVVQCLALANYTDLRVLDVNGEATFEVVDNATQQPVAGAKFQASAPGELVLDPDQGGLYDNQLLKITVTYEGKSDTTLFRISL